MLPEAAFKAIPVLSERLFRGNQPIYQVINAREAYDERSEN